MSVNVRRLEVGPGTEEYVDQAWRLKERIRHREGVLNQRKNFFINAYRRSNVYLYVDETNDQLIGFATVRRDGYILFLAVAEEYRRQDFGKRLVARVAEEFGRVTCHARTTNQGALEFYRALGFEVKRRVPNYYEDGGDAYYLQLGEDASIREKLANFLRR